VLKEKVILAYPGDYEKNNLDGITGWVRVRLFYKSKDIRHEFHRLTLKEKNKSLIF